MTKTVDWSNRTVLSVCLHRGHSDPRTLEATALCVHTALRAGGILRNEQLQFIPSGIWQSGYYLHFLLRGFYSCNMIDCCFSFLNGTLIAPCKGSRIMDAVSSLKRPVPLPFSSLCFAHSHYLFHGWPSSVLLLLICMLDSSGRDRLRILAWLILVPQDTRSAAVEPQTSAPRGKEAPSNTFQQW